ncbi:YafY family protein [Pedobacter frigidisoli]|uniref:helix-turn-helix transcriptional regulator n=1 Tax=Pedobacter frigidisoli TaxID=2530455 RepID=UPI0029319F32|nr:YafY family protein [Pedobacter frigidisoli]
MDNIKRFDRILQLYFILQSKVLVSIDELEERFDMSRRTIYRDIKALEDAGVPISSIPGTGFSIMDGFRIRPSKFTPEEVMSLMIAEKIMHNHETKFVKKHFEHALVKIKSSFQITEKNILANLGETVLINDKKKQTLYLPDVINLLVNSAANREVVSIVYRKSSDKEYLPRTIEPIGVFYESEYWYLLAYCGMRGDYRNFRLDRIQQVRAMGEKFKKSHPSMETLKSEVTSKPVTLVTVKMDYKFAHYLFWERDNFGFVKEYKSDDDVMMDFELTEHPTSFVRWFMKFADLGEIVSPETLTFELRELIKAAYKNTAENNIV